MDTAEKELKQVQDQLIQAQHYANLEADCQRQQRLLQELEPQLEQAQLTSQRAAKEAEQGEALTEEQHRYEREQEKFRQIEAEGNKLVNMETSLHRLELQRAQTEQKMVQLQAQVEAGEKQLKEAQEAQLQLAQCEKQTSQIALEINKYQNLLSSMQQGGQLKQQLEQKQQDYQKAEVTRDQLRLRYEALEKAFLDGQAGLLAQHLQPGIPCPVCGATEHPCPAIAAGELPDKKKLDTEKKKLDQAEGQVSRLSGEAGGLRQRLAEEKERFLHIGCELLQLPSTTEVGELYSLAKENYQRLEQESRELEERGRQLTKLAGRVQALEGSCQQLQQQQKELQDALQEQERALAAAKGQQEELTQQVDRLAQELGLAQGKAGEILKIVQDSLVALQQKAEGCKCQRLQLEQQAQLAEKRYQQLQTEYAAAKGGVAGLAKQLAGLQKVEAEGLLEQQSLWNSKKQAAQRLQQELFAQYKQNSTIHSKVAKQQEQVVVAEQRLQLLKALSDTAMGKLTGKQKIELETFIQMHYFDRIIELANVRLMGMTGGHYELKREEEGASVRGNAKSGLELSVIDHYNGTERSVKTLSGGETFLASLALALGLADQVQCSTGGIKLDTMFVDEGFGSLDDSSLKQAVETLLGLSENNRLVGIISHVSELQEMIDKKIKVTKQRNGSSIQVIS